MRYSMIYNCFGKRQIPIIGLYWNPFGTFKGKLHAKISISWWYSNISYGQRQIPLIEVSWKIALFTQSAFSHDLPQFCFIQCSEASSRDVRTMVPFGFIYIYIKYSAFSVLDVELLLGLWSYKVYPLMNSICRGLKKVQKFFQRGRSTGLAANYEKLFRQALIWRQKFEFTQPWCCFLSPQDCYSPRKLPELL